MNYRDYYISLLQGTEREGVNDLITWLEGTDFFEAPASTRFHGAHKHGLLQHSIQVYQNMDWLSREYNLEIPESSSDLVALIHDICKADYYAVSTRNVKNSAGVWVQEPYYTVDDRFPVGHGEKSVIIAQKFIRLTDEEAAAIRWHMGGFDEAAATGGLSTAYGMYKLAPLLHMADMQATYLDQV